MKQAGELLAVEAIDRTGMVITSEGALVRIINVTPPNHPGYIEFPAMLLVVFAIRLGKTKKFMPSGLMLVITVLALAFRHL